MRLIAAIAVLLGALTPVTSLQPLEPFDRMKVACGCSFYRLDPDDPSNSIPGTELVLLDVNAEPPHALLNLGDGNVQLWPDSPIEFPMYRCSPGSEFSSIWLNNDIKLSVDLAATTGLLEGCRFQGTASVSGDYVAISEIVNGACSC